MQEFEPIRKNPTISSENQAKTTLVIQNIPSDIAYETIMTAISRGNLSTDKVRHDINEKLGYTSSKDIEPEIYYHESQQNNEPIHLHTITEQRAHNLVWQKVESPEFTILEECRCCDCGHVFAHRIKDEEKEQIFTDFGAVERIFANDVSNEVEHNVPFDEKIYDETSDHGYENTPDDTSPQEEQTHRTR